MAITQELIDKINFLANKKKQEGLSKSETELQSELRKLYLKEFKKNTKSVLENLDIFKEMEISRFLVDQRKLDYLVNNNDVKAVKKSGVNYVVTYDYRKTSEKKILKEIRSIN